MPSIYDYDLLDLNDVTDDKLADISEMLVGLIDNLPEEWAIRSMLIDVLDAIGDEIYVRNMIREKQSND